MCPEFMDRFQCAQPFQTKVLSSSALLGLEDFELPLANSTTWAPIAEATGLTMPLPSHLRDGSSEGLEMELNSSVCSAL